METIKQTIRVPENHELKIKIPSYIPANEELVLFIKKKRATFRSKINELNKSKSDKLFLEDLQNALDDFKFANADGL